MARLKISEIKNNPNNPRLIKDDNFKKLVQSLKQLPIMLEKRPVLIDEDNIIIGGNMRHKAAKDAGLKEIPVEYFTREDAKQNNIEAKKLDSDYVDRTYEQQREEMIIKDNVSGGEWDWDMLANEWDTELLEQWGLNLSNANSEEPEDLELKNTLEIAVEFDNDTDLQQLYEELTEREYKCRILTL